MLFFLRKVRQKLLAKNKLTTYVLYAVGEILLVVVGILIAVSIDHWKEDMDIDAATNNYLVHLKTEVEENKESLLESLEINEGIISTGRQLVNLIANDTISYTEEDLAYLMSSSLAPNLKLELDLPVLKELVGSGNIKRIDNRELRMMLINFNPTIDAIRYDEEILQSDREYCINEIRRHGSLRVMFDASGLSEEELQILPSKNPGSNEKLLKSKVFENNLLLFLANSISRQGDYESLMEMLDYIIELLDEETKS